MIDCKWLGYACVKKERELELENLANPATCLLSFQTNTEADAVENLNFYTVFTSTLILWSYEEEVFLYEFAFVYRKTHFQQHMILN